MRNRDEIAKKSVSAGRLTASYWNPRYFPRPQGIGSTVERGRGAKVNESSVTVHERPRSTKKFVGWETTAHETRKIGTIAERLGMDDDELFTLIKADGAARDRAISQLRSILLRGLSKSLNHRYGQPFNAEDIVQEALMKVLHSLDKFEGRSKFTTWAMTVATRVGISALRRKYHQDVSLEPFSAADGYSIEIPVFDEPTLSNTESRAKILSLLQSLIETELTDRQRLATRAFLSDFATDEIAEQLNMNRNAVYKLIHDARRKLKDGFERAGLTSQAIFDELSEGNK